MKCINNDKLKYDDLHRNIVFLSFYPPRGSTGLDKVITIDPI